MLGRVADEGGQRERQRQERQPVEDDGDPLRLAVADELRHELRREGQERREQQHEQVEPVERRVRGRSAPVIAECWSQTTPIVRKLVT